MVGDGENMDDDRLYIRTKLEEILCSSLMEHDRRLQLQRLHMLKTLVCFAPCSIVKHVVIHDRYEGKDCINGLAKFYCKTRLICVKNKNEGDIKEIELKP